MIVRRTFFRFSTAQPSKGRMTPPGSGERGVRAQRDRAARGRSPDRGRHPLRFPCRPAARPPCARAPPGKTDFARALFPRHSPPAYDPDMALRFYRRFRLFPGMTLNLSKRGISTSIGVRGAHITIGTHGTRETLGIPGTGIGYTAFQPRRRRRASGHVSPPVEPVVHPSPAPPSPCRLLWPQHRHMPARSRRAPCDRPRFQPPDGCCGS
jgi:Protein of unknown function (DUF4236)